MIRATTPHPWVYLTVSLALAGLAAASAPAAADSYVLFESGQVRPLALSPDGTRLFVVNTPDNRLEVFNVDAGGLIHVESIPVGMEPVAVAARSDLEVWVVNHLSDNVSVVSIGQPGTSRVTATLRVGDEPRDIVFAGEQRDRAFITAANRNLPRTRSNPERGTDVWVFDANEVGIAQAQGEPLAIVNLFADSPRALAVSADGQTVYAAPFFSGNRTSVVSGNVVDGNLPPPLTNVEGAPAPSVGLVIKFEEGEWRDAAGRSWSGVTPIELPDWDVFALDASADPPQQIAAYSGVGTVLFNMVSNPVSGKLYVSNLESRNHVRFEGPGDFGGSTVRGHIAESRISILDLEGGVEPRHLNKHIDYDVFPGTPEENANSLAFPTEMVLSSDGQTLYTTAFGSSKVGVFDVSTLEDDSFVPSQASHIEVTGGGPSGLVLDETHERLYVLTRFDNAISVIALGSGAEVAHLPMYNPEPQAVTEGRRFLYDARYTSSRGDSACASCHIFGDLDGLAWDLGNPDDFVLENTNLFRRQLPGVDIDFHPMKGPMTTQSLRGMANHGPMHWRGDRTGGTEGGDPMDEELAFKAFNPAFEALLGRTAPLTDEEMQAFTEFVLRLTYPPNPVRAPDNSLTPAQARGRDFFLNAPSGAQDFTCNDCHVLDPVQGFFGSDGLSVTRPIGGIKALKIPHLRNLYAREGIDSTRALPIGPQVKGFGFSHDGSVSSLFTFVSNEFFDFPGGEPQRMDVVQFLLAFDSNLAPIVGRQVTVTPANVDSARAQVVLLNRRAAVTEPRPECDLIIKGVVNGEARGWWRTPRGLFRSDRASEPLVGLTALITQALQEGHELTFTAVPPGAGIRMGIDRDEDGVLDRDEIDAGSNGANRMSMPAPR
jgi:DNA-binding beta-propeller fold protein YncE